MSTAGQVITCKAAVAWEAGKALTIEDVQVDPPKSHEVRIKVMSTGVCHTDWAYLYETGQSMSYRPFPLILGHEGAGIVESVGPGVTKFLPGDKVIPLFLPQCGECERCRSPKTNQCRKNCTVGQYHFSTGRCQPIPDSVNGEGSTWRGIFNKVPILIRANTQVGVLADGTSRISCRGQQVYQFLGVCSFSQFTVVPDTSLAKINSNAPLDKVCLLGCGVSTGYGAALRTAQVEKDSVCAVFGLGAVGLAAVMGCKAAGAKKIIAIDKNPAKFEKARVMGATECLNPKDLSEPIQDVLRERFNGGVDYALECVGSTCVMSAALESTIDAWGVCVIAGWTETEAMSINVEMLLKGRTLKGTYFGGWKGVDDLPILVDKYMKKELRLDEFITHNLSLDQINQAFEHMKTGDSIRSVISLW